jgi:hypothetical protein
MRKLLGKRPYDNNYGANRFMWLLGREFRSDIAHLCKSINLPFFDPTTLEIFRSARPVFQDYWHYNDDGHLALGQALHEWWCTVARP